MVKTPQVKPDWNTGIYIGDGVVAKPKEKQMDKRHGGPFDRGGADSEGVPTTTTVDHTNHTSTQATRINQRSFQSTG
jgi:hypothetical protein